MARDSSAEISASERAFLDEIRAFHASGGELDEEVVLGTVSSEPAPRLFHAASMGWCTTMNWLIGRGADIQRCKAKTGTAPLSCAAARNQYDAAVILLDAGAHVEQRSSGQRTALHFCAYNGHFAMVKLLLSRGASYDVRDWLGNDPEADVRGGRWQGLADRTEIADLLAAVREAGGWRPYVDAPRQELLALRRELPSLRERGLATSSSSVPLHERLFVKAPEDVFQHTIAYWRAPRDL
jgi:hypothetical protein